MKNISICLLLILSIFLFTTSCTETDSQLPEVSPEEVADNDEAVDFDNSQVEEPEFTFPEPSAVENNYHLEEAFPGLFFTRPLDLQNAGDGSGRLFVVEQAGMIYVVEGPAYSEKEVFLDIRELVDDSGNEMGLLGLAFHPQYIENAYFYINYTDRSGTVIARFNASGNIAEPASRKTIMSFSQPYRNHNGGQLSFGPDGYLYISTGDGGSGGDPQGHGQNLQTIHGNILRIDVNSERSEGNYTIPPDNPFTNSDEGALEEIYAYGLRNPWRFSFDPMTGNLWAADVGQNRVEEINIIEKGKNYGWNILEGSLCFNPSSNCDSTGLELPVYEYRHPLGRSITGGHVYRGSNLPDLYGAYIYADFVSGLVWGLWYEEGKNPINYLLADTGLNISSFGIDEDLEIYLTAFDGKVYRLKKN